MLVVKSDLMITGTLKDIIVNLMGAKSKVDLSHNFPLHESIPIVQINLAVKSIIL